jgi:hypothetical protein
MKEKRSFKCKKRESIKAKVKVERELVKSLDIRNRWADLHMMCFMIIRLLEVVPNINQVKYITQIKNSVNTKVDRKQRLDRNRPNTVVQSLTNLLSLNLTTNHLPLTKENIKKVEWLLQKERCKHCILRLNIRIKTSVSDQCLQQTVTAALSRETHVKVKVRRLIRDQVLESVNRNIAIFNHKSIKNTRWNLNELTKKLLKN